MAEGGQPVERSEAETHGGALRRVADGLLRPGVFAPVLLALGTLVSLWFANRELPTPDEGGVLTNAARILRGAVFYRDLDGYPFPGAPYLLALWMRLFGEHLSVARGLAALLYCGMLASLYFASLRVLDRPRAALFGLSLLSLKLLGWPAFTSYLHSDVSFYFACFAIALALSYWQRGGRVRLLLSGLCVGAALASKQNLGIYLGAALVGLLLFPAAVPGAARLPARRRGAEVGVFALGMAILLVPFAAFFASHGVFGQMVHSGLVRPLTAYLPTSGIPFAPMLAWWNLGEFEGSDVAAVYLPLRGVHLLREGLMPGAPWYPSYWIALEIFSRALYASLPIAFLWAFARWVRSARGGHATHRDSLVFRLAVLSLAVVLSAFPRADFFHIMSVYPLVALLCFALLEPRTRVRRRISLWAETGAVASLLGATLYLAAVYDSGLTYRMKLERADVYVSPNDSWVKPVVETVSESVPAHQQIFVYGNEAQFYFLTGRFFPWPFSQLYQGQEGGDGGAALAALLSRLRPAVVLAGLMDWPGVPTIDSYAPQLSEFIESHYSHAWAFFEFHPPPQGAQPSYLAFKVLRPAAGAPPPPPGFREPAAAQ